MGSALKEVVLGIDLGTTNSLGAVYEADGKVIVLPNADGMSLTPSVVNLQNENSPVVGIAAVNQMAFAPDYTVRLFKRSMGRIDPEGKPITVYIHPDSGRLYPPEELSSHVIRYIIQSVEANQGVKVVGVVITVPAYFEDPARCATKRAGELAGVPVLGIVNEPTAAALAFGLGRDESGIFVVYDLGGGTFDVSVIEISGQEITVLATDGDRDLGGSDIDNLILEKAIAAFKNATGIEITSENDLPAWIEILSKCETAKRSLSQGETASFVISAQGERLVFELTRADLNALIAPMPAEKEDRFALVSAGQTEARVTVAQGPDGALPTDCTIIGELVLGGLPPGPLTERIIVNYGLTSEGTLAIAATDTVSGKRTTDVRRDLTDLIKRMKQS